MDLDQDGNGVLDTDELMPILDLLYNFILKQLQADKIKFESDHWIEFAQIFDTNGDGVLQMDEFETYCRWGGG